MATQDMCSCSICGSELGNIKLNAPLYCIPCIEEMGRLNMSPKKYRRYRELKETLAGK